MIGRQQKLVGKLRVDFPTAAGTAGRIFLPAVPVKIEEKQCGRRRTV